MLVDVILPMLLLVAAGWVLGRWRRPDPAGVTDVVLYLFMPLLAFTSLVRDPLSLSQAGRTLAWYVGFSVSMWGVASLAGRLLRWSRPERGALGLVFTGINVGSYGVPVILFVLGDQVLAQGMLLMVASNAAAGTLGVYLAAGGHLQPRQAALSILRMPMIHGVVAALLVQASGVTIPGGWLETAHHAGMAGPTLALAVLGLQLSRVDWSNVGRRLWVIAVVKLGLGSLAGAGLALALGAAGEELTTLVVMGCMPTAINAVMLSVRFDARPDLVSGACLLTTLLSPLALIGALGWLGERW